MDLEKAIEYTFENINNSTKFEIIVKNKLDILGIEYYYQYPIYDKNIFYIIDFYIPKLNIYLEIDGNHHYTNNGLKYDKKRRLFISNILKAKEIRIKNNDVEKFDINSIFNIKKHNKNNNKHKLNLSKYKLTKRDRLLQQRYDMLG